MKTKLRHYIVAFYGDCDNVFSSKTESELKETLETLYRKSKDTNSFIQFYCGTSGSFESLVSSSLDAFRLSHPDFRFEKAFVAPYIQKPPFKEGYDTAIYPPVGDDIEIPAVQFYEWLLDQADVLIVYAQSRSEESNSVLRYAKEKRKTIVLLNESVI